MSAARPGLGTRIRLVLRIWALAVGVATAVRREPLPQLVRDYSAPAPGNGANLPPWMLSRAVDRALRIGSVRPRCLVNALVLYRLLREQGDGAELVIGLPDDANDHLAHAWVELNGRDVGPPPGRGNHEPLARFGP